jgi:ABC-type iron transport system FetAB ATPase subunit
VTIADVLNMSVEEGVNFFAGEPAVSKKIQVLADLGLGYLTLGQSATTLSGGEAQRIKIATELSTLQLTVTLTNRAKATVDGAHASYGPGGDVRANFMLASANAH